MGFPILERESWDEADQRSKFYSLVEIYFVGKVMVFLSAGTMELDDL